jgi:hypothetical protein
VSAVLAQISRGAAQPAVNVSQAGLDLPTSGYAHRSNVMIETSIGDSIGDYGAGYPACSECSLVCAARILTTAILTAVVHTSLYRPWWQRNLPAAAILLH